MISLVISCDTRAGYMDTKTVCGAMLDGVRSVDFLTDGIQNKVNFFKGHLIEVILFVDKHEEIPADIVNSMVDMVDSLTINKHTETLDGEMFPRWNDLNYLYAISRARGKYVCHVDGDMALFTNTDVVAGWLNSLESGEWDFICYPSHCSPLPADDSSFDYTWASTRFFMARREMIDYTEIFKCLMDSDYLYGKHGNRDRKCPWFEHIIALINGPAKVLYPPMNMGRYMIFAWAAYAQGLFGKLNAMPYSEVLTYVKKCGSIKYPCDVKGISI